MNARWVWVAEDRWELRSLKGKKLGSIVRFPASQWAVANGAKPHMWAALPRGRNYWQPTHTIRLAALDLEAACGVESSNVMASIRQASARVA